MVFSISYGFAQDLTPSQAIIATLAERSTDRSISSATYAYGLSLKLPETAEPTYLRYNVKHLPYRQTFPGLHNFAE